MATKGVLVAIVVNGLIKCSLKFVKPEKQGLTEY